MDNVVADALSRIETNTLLTGQPLNEDFAAMAVTQATDPQIRCLQSSPNSTLVVEALPLPNSTHPLYCYTSTSTQRPLDPVSTCQDPATLSSFSTPIARFNVVHSDFVGLLPPSQGFTYLLT